jgi:uncharacterized protein
VTTPLSRRANAPVSTTDRVLALDVLRGWAVGGMLVVNFGYFSQQGLAPRAGADAVGRPLVQFLADGKFFTLFAVLFGIGVAMQLERATARGAAFAPIYVRRLLILFLIGLVHVLLHPLEILHRYAVLGLLLLPLRAVSTRALISVGVAALVAPPVLSGLAVGQPPEIAESARLYSEAGLPELLSHNLARFRRDAIDIRVLAPFPYFVFGLYWGRRGRLQALTDGGERLARGRWWMLGLGVGLQAAVLAVVVAAPTMVPTMARPVIPMLLDLGSALVGLFYACVIVLMLKHARWRRRLSGLASVGRMALSNYLLQTIVVTTLLYGYGAGLHGRLGIVTGLPLVGLIFLVQVAVSRWWLAHFRFGPAEWLWRSATYGRLQPLRLER